MDESYKQAGRQLGVLSAKWASWHSGQEHEKKVAQMHNSETGLKQMYLRVGKGSGWKDGGISVSEPSAATQVLGLPCHLSVKNRKGYCQMCSLRHVWTL